MILFDDDGKKTSLPINLDEDAPPPARIKVVGVGGGGGNATRMVASRRGTSMMSARASGRPAESCEQSE